MTKNSHGTLDWRKVHERVEFAFAAISRDLNRPEEEVRRILQDRAQALARPETEASAAETVEVLMFGLAHECYALETHYVREVYPLDNLTPLPGVPAFVMGIANIRGEILSAIDIKKFLRLPEQGITHLNKLIVLQHGSMVFGVLADEIHGVRHLKTSEIHASRPASGDSDPGYLKGITASGLALLDAYALLTDDKLIVQD